MALLEDLNHSSITEMQTNEAIELLRQIRLGRRVPVKKVKTIRKKTKPAPKVNSNQAAELLKILGGN
jgi:hypothetical protein